MDGGLTADPFGFRKLLVLSTEVGKVFALRTDTGQIVWSHRFDSNLEQLVAVKVIRSVTMKVPPLLAVITKNVHKSKTVVYRWNAMNGRPLKEGDLGDRETFEGFSVEKVLRLPVQDPQFGMTVLALVGSSNGVRLYPRDPRILDLLQPHWSSMFFTSGGQVGDRWMAGHLLVEDRKSASGIASMVHWNWTMPGGKDEVIVAVAEKPQQGILLCNVL
jgi:hypothetical protein